MVFTPQEKQILAHFAFNPPELWLFIYLQHFSPVGLTFSLNTMEFPLALSGNARGTWAFEAKKILNTPILLYPSQTG